MPYLLELRKHVEKEFERIAKKSPIEEGAIKKKLVEILENPQRFKPLRKPMHGWWRVHIAKSFVLIYSIDEARKTVILEDYTHHDEAYR
jgi:YafQ family addiction module toxin component